MTYKIRIPFTIEESRAIYNSLMATLRAKWILGYDLDFIHWPTPRGLEQLATTTIEVGTND